MAVPSKGQQFDQRRDGNWWMSQSMDYKLSYIVGLFDGIRLGHDLSVTTMLKSSKENNKALSKALDSFDGNSKLLEGVTNIDLVKQLDHIYSDAQNRQIRLRNAVRVAVSKIAGRPEQEINEMVEAYRQMETITIVMPR